jgi:hypothetical protein
MKVGGARNGVASDEGDKSRTAVGFRCGIVLAAHRIVKVENLRCYKAAL